jgi:glycosyltransferase involved in cell wall biosynthesis
VSQAGQAANDGRRSRGADRRILIDALAARYGGAAYATVALARELARKSEIATVLVVTRRDSIVERGLAGAQGVECVALAKAARMELVRRLAWETLRLRGLVGRRRCAGVISMSGMLLRPVGCPLVCVLANPVLYERRTLANLLRRWAVRRTARHATYLAAPSRPMADLVSASVDRDCAALPFGVDHGVFRPPAKAGREILCVADFYAHKRHDLLLDAWLALPSPRPGLRLVGNPAVDPQAHARLVARIEALEESDSIVLEYRVPLQRLVHAYESARVFVMPSEHESFCMPLAESMACGVPAVVRAIPSLRETGGAGATYLDGDDPTRWAAAIGRLIEGDGEHDRARRSAIEAAARFSWDSFAAELAAHL